MDGCIFVYKHVRTDISIGIKLLQILNHGNYYIKKDRLSYMTTSHITVELAPLAVSLCSFSSWFASHMHILHCLDSMFTSVPARAKTPTQTGSILSWSRAFFAPVSVQNWSNAKWCSDAWRCNHEGKRTERRLIRSQLQWIWHPSTLLSRRTSLSGFLPPAVSV